MNLIIYILIFLVLVIIYLSINVFIQKNDLNSLQEDIVLKDNLNDIALKTDISSLSISQKYALKTDISSLSISQNYALKSELPSDYVKSEELNNLATKTDISGLSNIYARKGEVNSQSIDLTPYAKINDISGFATLNDISGIAKITDISGLSNIYARKGEVSSQSMDLTQYAKMIDISGVAKLSDISGVAKLSDISGFATLKDISGVAKLSDISGVAKLSDISSLSDVYALNTELNKYALLENVPSQQDISNINIQLSGLSDIYAKKTDIETKVTTKNIEIDQSGNLCIDTKCLDINALSHLTTYHLQVPDYLCFIGPTIQIMGATDKDVKIKNIILYDNSETPYNLIQTNWVGSVRSNSGTESGSSIKTQYTDQTNKNKIIDINNTIIQTFIGKTGERVYFRFFFEQPTSNSWPNIYTFKISKIVIDTGVNIDLTLPIVNNTGMIFGIIKIFKHDNTQAYPDIQLSSKNNTTMGNYNIKYEGTKIIITPVFSNQFNY